MIVLAYEMGLKPDEVLGLTLSQFNLMYTGYKRRREDDWDIARRTWAYILNFGGMGVKGDKVIQHTELLTLDRDRGQQKRVIRTLNDALKILKEFE